MIIPQGMCPYLVSRLCQLMDEMYKNGIHEIWTHTGLLNAVRKMVRDIKPYI